MLRTLKHIFLNSIPILIMVGLIPFVVNDYLITVLFIIITLLSFFIKREKNDLLIFLFGFLIMIFFESYFLATGVETFNRVSFFKNMPLWLPFLWAYGFVAIKRSVILLEKI